MSSFNKIDYLFVYYIFKKKKRMDSSNVSPKFCFRIVPKFKLHPSNSRRLNMTYCVMTNDQSGRPQITTTWVAFSEPTSFRLMRLYKKFQQVQQDSDLFGDLQTFYNEGELDMWLHDLRRILPGMSSEMYDIEFPVGFATTKSYSVGDSYSFSALARAEFDAIIAAE